MKLTTKQLKELIKEEVQKLDETGDRFGSETHRTAAAFGGKDEEEFKAMVDQLIGRRGMSADQLKRLIDEVAGVPLCSITTLSMFLCIPRGSS